MGFAVAILRAAGGRFSFISKSDVERFVKLETRGKEMQVVAKKKARERCLGEKKRKKKEKENSNFPEPNL